MFLMTQERMPWRQIYRKRERMGKDDEFHYEHADVEIPDKMYSSRNAQRDLDI